MIARLPDTQGNILFVLIVWRLANNSDTFPQTLARSIHIQRTAIITPIPEFQQFIHLQQLNTT